MAVEQQKFNDTQPTVSEHIGEFVTNYLFIYLFSHQTDTSKRQKRTIK